MRTAEEGMELTGAWTVARHTVCVHCDRYRLTDAEAVCRPCALRLAVTETAEVSADDMARIEAHFDYGDPLLDGRDTDLFGQSEWEPDR
jgi:predicted metal-binding transcription factor (methanogenesis marker protein 9)